MRMSYEDTYVCVTDKLYEETFGSDRRQFIFSTQNIFSFCPALPARVNIHKKEEIDDICSIEM